MRPDVDGDQTIGKVFKPAKEVWSPVAYCPRSSLPVEVLAWLADVDEDTFYKWQRRASDTIAAILWEENAKIARDAGA